MKRIIPLIFIALTGCTRFDQKPNVVQEFKQDTVAPIAQPNDSIVSMVKTDSGEIRVATKPTDTAWVNIRTMDPDIVIDMRYATENNFVKAKMYDCGECYLRAGVAKALQKVENELEAQGFHLKMFDCYRPRPFQQRLWDKYPDDRFVTPPAKGSMHTRGAATDLTIVDAKGKELDMGTGFDFFGERAFRDYKKLPEEVLKNRQLLRSTMEKHGFSSITSEWWHFAYYKGHFNLSAWVWECK